MFIDLDRFKAVNDSLGHTVGDQLLSQVGRRLQTALRREDVIGRYGGDEFVAVAQVADPGEALGLAERIRELLAEPFPDIPDHLGISASIGVVLAQRARDRSFVADQLIRAADHAMYEAKATGGNRAVVHRAG
jgi:diguanylate cyclase (GGDEF)-like protein